jgi:hypothetical protein
LRPVANGLCRPHHDNNRRRGDPTMFPKRRADSTRNLSHGYVRIKIPGHPMADKSGWAYEHRVVLFDAGIDPSGNIGHHKNENKQDNHLENLERMSRPAHGAKHNGKPLAKCPVCDREYKQKRTKTCGYSCGQLLRHANP